MWLWRIVPKQGRGEHRVLVDNVQYEGWEHVWTHRRPAPGRYRLEFRDARRAIVAVRYANVPDPHTQQAPYLTSGRARRPQRTVAPARPAWEPLATPPPAARPAPAAQARTQPAPAATRPAASNPPLRPPGAAPSGTLWRLRQSGAWEPFNRSAAIPASYRLLWLADSNEVVLVFTPTGGWPGYVVGKLKDGRPCLVPSAPRT